MAIDVHLLALQRVLAYQAPADLVHRPRDVKPGHEEVEVITAGFGRFRLGDRYLEAGPGDTLWYLPGERIEAISPKHEPYACVVFDFEVVGCPWPRPPRLGKASDPAARIDAALRWLRAFARQPSVTPWWTLQVYTALLSDVQHQRDVGTHAVRPTSIDRALAFIASHAHEPIQVEDIAEAADLSASHLHALFRSHLDATPHQLLQTHRLAKSRELLAATALPIKQIAQATGYPNTAHFCRTFREAVHLTPTAYRQSFKPPWQV